MHCEQLAILHKNRNDRHECRRLIYQLIRRQRRVLLEALREERIRRAANEAIGRNSDQLFQELREEMRVGRKEELTDLMAAFGRRVHEEHPNPERSGCPGLSALTALAGESVPLASPILDHIGNCAHCLDELRRLRLPSKQSE
jgi:hypothetical protein